MTIVVIYGSLAHIEIEWEKIIREREKFALEKFHLEGKFPAKTLPMPNINLGRDDSQKKMKTKPINRIRDTCS